jgi:hypothetical protein
MCMSGEWPLSSCSFDDETDDDTEQAPSQIFVSKSFLDASLARILMNGNLRNNNIIKKYIFSIHAYNIFKPLQQQQKGCRIDSSLKEFLPVVHDTS